VPIFLITNGNELVSTIRTIRRKRTKHTYIVVVVVVVVEAFNKIQSKVPFQIL